LNFTNKVTKHTWTKRRISIVIAVALIYGTWFNILDTAGYCKNKQELMLNNSCNIKCDVIPVGDLFGGNAYYQPWNVIGHLIPGLFLVWLTPKKVELFVAGALISSVVMDSPLWGFIREEGHELPLWHIVKWNNKDFVNTCDIGKWIQFYYNPAGFYGVWEFSNSFPSAALIFWSLIARSAAAGLLIWWQGKQEDEGKEFSLPKLVLRIGKRD